MNEPTVDTREESLSSCVPLALLALLVIGLTDVGYTQTLFVHTTYFFLMATVLCWAGTYLHAGTRRAPGDDRGVGEGKLARAGHCARGDRRRVRWPFIRPCGFFPTRRTWSERRRISLRRGPRPSPSPARTTTTATGTSTWPSTVGRRCSRSWSAWSTSCAVTRTRTCSVQLAAAAGVRAGVVPAGKVLGGETSGEAFGIVAVAARGVPSHHAHRGPFGRVRLLRPLLLAARHQESARPRSRAVRREAGDPLDESVHVRRDPLRERAVHRAGGGAAARLPAGQLDASCVPTHSSMR